MLTNLFKRSKALEVLEQEDAEARREYLATVDRHANASPSEQPKLWTEVERLRDICSNSKEVLAKATAAAEAKARAEAETEAGLAHKRAVKELAALKEKARATQQEFDAEIETVAGAYSQLVASSDKSDALFRSQYETLRAAHALAQQHGLPTDDLAPYALADHTFRTLVKRRVEALKREGNVAAYPLRFLLACLD